MPYFNDLMPTPREIEVIKERKRECPPEFNDRRFRITTNDRYGNTKTYVGNGASKLLYYGKLEAKRLRKKRRREERLKKQREAESQSGDAGDYDDGGFSYTASVDPEWIDIESGEESDGEEDEEGRSSDPVVEVCQNSVSENVAALLWGINMKRKRNPYRQEMLDLMTAWRKVLPEAFITYTRFRRESRNFQTPLRGDKVLDLNEPCVCTKKSRIVTLISLEEQWQEDVQFCPCSSESIRLIERGFMPVTMTFPETAISFRLLSFFHVIWQHVPIAVQGFADGLFAWQSQLNGVVRAKGSHKARNGGPLIRQAMQFYRELLLRERKAIDKAVNKSLRDIVAGQCPCCFGPRKEYDLTPGTADFVIACDGNFEHSRPTTAAQNDFPKNHPDLFLKTNQLDKARLAVLTNGGNTTKIKFDDSACSDQWKAKDGGVSDNAFKDKVDTGLFGMVCRHEIGLKLINLVKTGEKLYNPLALVLWILQDVDKEGRLALLYDIGCNFEAHIKKRNLLAEERGQNRLLIGVSIFHAYAHNWLCQMRYNPRLIAGFGFSDGENSERFWSKLSPLVRLNRTASSSLRLLNINFLVEHINEKQLKGLVSWLDKHFQLNVKRFAKALSGMADAAKKGWTENRLLTEWKKQQEAQSKAGEQSEAAHRQKRYENLGRLVELSDEVTTALETLDTALAQGNGDLLRDVSVRLVALAERRRTLSENIQEAVAKLSVNGDVEEMKQLCRVHAAFVSLRQQFRKYKAVTEKFEQTRNGRKPKLGTKNTQRYSRQLRSPALTAAIKKYDLAVKNYAETFNPKTVPEFAVSLEALQAKDDEDIFWDDMIFDIKEADWSRNQDCRQGIKFMLMRDRAVEEKARLQAETARLIRWCHNRHNNIEESISKYKSRTTAPSSSNSTGPTADCNDINIFLLEETKERHAALEEQWMGDGLWRIWDKRPEPCLEDEGVEDILIMLRERVGIRWGFGSVNVDGDPSGDEVYVEEDREIVEVDVLETDGEEGADDREDVGAGTINVEDFTIAEVT